MPARAWILPQVDRYNQRQVPTDDNAHAIRLRCHVDEALRDVVREIETRLTQEATHAEAVRLMSAAYILSGLRVKRSDLADIYRGVGLMSESTAYDEAIEEGELRASHKTLLRQGRKLFGSPDESTESDLKSIRDLDRLERLVDAILTARSWQELLATP